MPGGTFAVQSTLGPVRVATCEPSTLRMRQVKVSGGAPLPAPVRGTASPWKTRLGNALKLPTWGIGSSPVTDLTTVLQPPALHACRETCVLAGPPNAAT